MSGCLLVSARRFYKFSSNENPELHFLHAEVYQVGRHGGAGSTERRVVVRVATQRNRRRACSRTDVTPETASAYPYSDDTISAERFSVVLPVEARRRARSYGPLVQCCSQLSFNAADRRSWETGDASPRASVIRRDRQHTPT